MKILESGKGIVMGLEKINLDDFPDLLCIGCNMTSCEHLPLEEMEKRGIKLISLKGHDLFLRSITSTAEHVFGLILALLRNYKTALHANYFPLLNGLYDLRGYKKREEYKGHTLSDKTLGIIGYGRIGRQLKRIGVGFSMTVITQDDGEPWLQNLLEESDIISLNIPLEGNEGFFTKEMFKSMKPTAYLINTSRDGVIEKRALLWALENGIIKGAAVDFIEDRGLVDYAREHDNLILTNHLGGCTEEDMRRTDDFITNLVNKYLENKSQTDA